MAVMHSRNHEYGYSNEFIDSEEEVVSINALAFDN
jgi:hypothetical protein